MNARFKVNRLIIVLIIALDEVDAKCQASLFCNNDDFGYLKTGSISKKAAYECKYISP